MINVLRKLFDESNGTAARAIPERQRHHLQIAVASLLHEASRVDLDERREEHLAAERALEDLFGLPADDCGAVLGEGRGKARQLISYFAPVSVIKRDFPLAERVRFIEHLWRIAYADGRLDPYEDHFVRKIAHLLYVPNTQCMVARNRARPPFKGKGVTGDQ
ncbi:MAG: TerB family tellurite resistance protein [Betaproteobacteria bacterium]|nr:TerB family tellurite resistance protein [Betaproteobacteria bacterium]MDH3437543.1 TerB family tellurite resistance protein [Betaproteobacteria bacterium]